MWAVWVSAGGRYSILQKSLRAAKSRKKNGGQEKGTPMKRTPKNERAGVAHVPNGVLHRFGGRPVIGGVV